MFSLFNSHGRALINLLQFIEDNVSGTDTESDDGTLGSKHKCCPEGQRYVVARLSSHPTLTTRPRNMKHTKSHQSLADVCPMVWNKPSGLVNNWYDIATTSTPQQSPPALHGYMFDLLYPASQSHVDDGAQFSLLSPLLQSLPVPAHNTEPLLQQAGSVGDTSSSTAPRGLRPVDGSIALPTLHIAKHTG